MGSVHRSYENSAIEMRLENYTTEEPSVHLRSVDQDA